MKLEKKLTNVKQAVEEVLHVEDISVDSRIEYISVARHLFVKICFKNITLDHSLIMRTINRSRVSFYNSYRIAGNVIDTDEYYRDVYKLILFKLKLIDYHEAYKI